MKLNNALSNYIRTGLFEVVISNTGASEFTLGSLPDIREAAGIVKIETFPVAQVTTTPSGKAVVNAGVFQKSFLRLINSENTEFKAIPLYALSKSVNGTEIPELNTPPIDPEKSKIVVGSTAGLVANEAWLLQITYLKKGAPVQQ